MKTPALIVLSLVSILASLAAIGGQPAPLQADSGIPQYGCPDLLYGSPIGGGNGYLDTVEPGEAQYVVSTAAALKTALATAAAGETVYVADGATIVLNDYAITTDHRPPFKGERTGFYVPPGVTLAGGRGRASEGTIRLASGFYNTSVFNLIALGAGARVTGLHIDGPQDSVEGGNLWIGVEGASGSEIANCEIHGFGYCGTLCYGGYVDVVDFWIHHSYIHHCRGTGYGYPVGVSSPDISHSASAIVEGNIIDYGRHCISASRGGTSYTFRYNRLEANAAFEWQCDVHGQCDDGGAYLQMDGGTYIYPAGVRIEVYNNTSLCTITNGYNEFCCIRGLPHESVSVHHNWWVGTGNTNVTQHLEYITGYMYLSNIGTQATRPYARMEQHDNWAGPTAPPSANRAPVLAAVGHRAVAERETLAFTIAATDADGDTLTYSASNLPSGATFNPATRAFSWTPGEGQAGVYAGIRFQVSDGDLVDSEDITITVSQAVFPDANGDGVVNAADITCLERIIVGLEGVTPGADANGDGTVNVADITSIERAIAGL